jgi:hypothetical protein
MLVISVAVSVIVVITMSMTFVSVMIPAKMVVTISGVQNFDLNQVEDQSNTSDQKHNPAMNFWRFEESVCRFD